MKTTVKVTIYNGSTKLRSILNVKEYNEQEAKDFVFNSLSNILDKQKQLKNLGVKNNFFGLSEFKENSIDIDITQGDEVRTIASGITFKFSQLQKVEDKKEAFNIIFDTQMFLISNGLLIE